MNKPLLVLMLLATCVPAATAQDSMDRERETLLQLMAQIETAINAKDVALAKAHLLPETILTFQDTTVAKGPAEIEAYFNRMLSGASSVLTGIHVKAEVDAPAVFYGNAMAVAYGHTTDTFEFRTGTTMELRTAWSTTVILRDGTWYLAALHFSNNLFDNPILGGAKSMAKITGIAGAVGGVLLMLLIGRLRKRKS